MTFKVGITDYVQAPFEIELNALGNDFELISLNLEKGDPSIAKKLKHLDALLVWHAEINTEVIRHLNNCKIVVRYGVGFDSIDIEALTQKGIMFCNTPDYGTEEVADTALALALTLSRCVSQYDNDCRDYTETWQENTIPGIKRLSNQTIGIIGIGRIGMSVLNRFKAFGCRVIGYDPYVTSGHEKALGYVRATTLEMLLEKSDIVSIHCPQTDETTGIINKHFLKSMKPDSILINTARGGLIESLDDLYDALKKKPSFKVGLDVLPEEPPQVNKLISAWRNREDWLGDRLIINPHTAYFSEQAWIEMRYKAAETIRLYLKHKTLRNQIKLT